MNRLIAIIFLLVLSISASSQKRLFKKALSDGLKKNGYYLLLNKRNKMIRWNDIKKYAEKNCYVLGDVSYKTIFRFGDYDETISTLEFLPKSTYESYIYSRFSKDTYTLPNPPVKCKALIFSTDNNNLRLVDAVNWSGRINDGKAEGKGVLATHSGNDILFVIGSFNSGFPIGEITITRYKDFVQYEKFSQSNLSKEKIIRVGEFNDGLAYLYSNGKYGFVNTQGNLIIKNEIDSIVSEFHDGQAVVIKNQEEQIINKIGNMIDYTESQKQIFASDSYLNKASYILYNNPDTALDMFNKSYRYGNKKSCYWLGRYYSYYSKPLDYSTAKVWYEIAADNGNVEALYELGNISSNYSFEDRNKETAFQWYLKAAQEGHSKAQSKVAESYETGDGVQQSRDEAFNWYLKLVEKGDINAEYRIAEMYKNEQNWDEAYNWYIKLANKGYNNAEYRIAEMYKNGTGVRADEEMAYKWFKYAYNHGHQAAGYEINAIEQERKRRAEEQARLEEERKRRAKEQEKLAKERARVERKRRVEEQARVEEKRLATRNICPNNNHPHAIDLGIGVRWACCNVGALYPEQYGDFFAWGDTYRKYNFNRDDYTYNKKDVFHMSYSIDIGKDISGTKYDVARIQWGYSWRMPNVREINKLIEKCSWTWAKMNGVNGYKVTGPNGNSIFLPAAGYRWRDVKIDVGENGYYWSSTHRPNQYYYDEGYTLYFYWDNASWGSEERCYGLSVRPVTN